jgi:hypothetical protein
MQAIRILIGIVFVLAGILLMVPLFMILWATFADKFHSGAGNGTVYIAAKIYIGGFTFSGFQMWLVLGVMAMTGLTLLIAGIYLMTAKKW